MWLFYSVSQCLFKFFFVLFIFEQFFTIEYEFGNLSKRMNSYCKHKCFHKYLRHICLIFVEVKHSVVINIHVQIYQCVQCGCIWYLVYISFFCYSKKHFLFYTKHWWIYYYHRGLYVTYILNNNSNKNSIYIMSLHIVQNGWHHASNLT